MAIQFNMRGGWVEVIMQGNVTNDDLRQLLASYNEAEARLPVTPDRITDLSQAVMTAIDAGQLREFSLARQAAQLKNNVKSAIIAPEPEQYGLARMFQAFNQNPKIEICLFRDAASAYTWIGRPMPATASAVAAVRPGVSA
jgi:hypothetical protein